MIRFVKYEVRINLDVVAAFPRLIDAVRYWRDRTTKNGVVLRVEEIYNEEGEIESFDEVLID